MSERNGSSNLQSADGEYSQHRYLCSTRHPKAQENPERQYKNHYIHHNSQGRLDDVEAIVDAPGVGVFPQLRVPIRFYRYTLKQSSEEDGDGVKGSGDDQSPDGPVNGVVVSLETQKKDQNRALDEGQDGIIAQLLEEVPPETSAGVVFGNLVFLPAVVVELENW